MNITLERIYISNLKLSNNEKWKEYSTQNNLEKKILKLE